MTIDNDADPALVVDFTIVGTQRVECIVTNTTETVTVTEVDTVTVSVIVSGSSS